MRTLALCCALVCVLNTGCMDLAMKFEIKSDWSNTIALRLEMLDQYYQLLQMQMKQMGSDPTLFDETSLRALTSEHGGKVNKFHNAAKDGFRQIDIEVWFPDARQTISGLAQGLMILERDGDVWILRVLDEGAAQSLGSMDQTQLEQQLTMLLPNLAGLQWQFDFVVPELADANINRLNPTTARYSLNFDEDVAGKSGKDMTDRFVNMLQPKWVKFKMKD